MTFDDARKRHLEWLDRYYAKLREKIADPQWCNEDWTPFKEGFKNFVDRIELIRQLNAAEVEAK